MLNLIPVRRKAITAKCSVQSGINRNYPKHALDLATYHVSTSDPEHRKRLWHVTSITWADPRPLLFYPLFSTEIFLRSLASATEPQGLFHPARRLPPLFSSSKQLALVEERELCRAAPWAPRRQCRRHRPSQSSNRATNSARFGLSPRAIHSHPSLISII